MEERPTCRVYIKILTCCAIIQHLEESRSNGNEWETERTRGQGARPRLRANQLPPRGLRVLFDRIPQILVFVYFCRGLSGNMEERPTRRVYIKILTCCAIIQHLEKSRSHGNEQETERTQGQSTRPPPLGARPGLRANQLPPRGSCSTDLRD